jgi:hypothetical protein
MLVAIFWWLASMQDSVIAVSFVLFAGHPGGEERQHRWDDCGRLALPS